LKIQVAHLNSRS